jgi:hypothetical protein
MLTVWKYSVPKRAGEYIIQARKCCKFLSVGFKGDLIFVWMLVDSQSKPREYKIGVYLTGDSIPTDPGDFIGTLVEEDPEWFVRHVFVKSHL